MILLGVGVCKKAFSDAGWQLFCQHRKAHGEPCPSTWPDDESSVVGFSAVELGQYEYDREMLSADQGES
jgi:hypothetical protein